MIKFWSPFSPKLKLVGSSNGVSVLAAGSPSALSVNPVEAVTVELWQHKSLVLVIFVNGSVDGLNDEV